MRVTVCELPCDTPQFEESWNQLVGYVRSQKSDFVLLPEMLFSPWYYAGRCFNPSEWRQAVDAHQLWEDRLADLAPATVVATRPAEHHDGRVNQGFVREPGRPDRALHQKHYLPNDEGFYEASWFSRGDGAFDLADVRACKLGMLICSELWSMGRAEEYGRQGMQILVSPRATMQATLDKWVVGGRAAAIVSGAFCLSSNRVGVGRHAPDVQFGGLGWVVDPDGRVLGTTSNKNPFLTVDIDLAAADRAKETYPRDCLR